MGSMYIEESDDKYMVEIYTQKIKEYAPLFERDGYSSEVGCLWRNYIHNIKEVLNMGGDQIFTYQELVTFAEEFANKMRAKEQV